MNERAAEEEAGDLRGEERAKVLEREEEEEASFDLEARRSEDAEEAMINAFVSKRRVVNERNAN